MDRVQNILHGRELYSVTSAQTVSEVARRMSELNIGAILVIDDGDLRGLFSERDLMMRVVVAARDPNTTPISAVMTRNLATIDETATVEEALECMHQHNCRHLPVMQEGRVSGFLSLRDLVNYELAKKTEELHHMRAYLATGS